VVNVAEVGSEVLKARNELGLRDAQPGGTCPCGRDAKVGGQSEDAGGGSPAVDVREGAGQGEGGEQAAGVIAAVDDAGQVPVVQVDGDDLRDVLRPQVQQGRAGVEVVGQPPVRGPSSEHHPGERGRHEGVVGKPAEDAVGGVRGELQPRYEARGRDLDVGGGEDPIRNGQDVAADRRTGRRADAPPHPTAGGGPLPGLLPQRTGPRGELIGAVLGGQVE